MKKIFLYQNIEFYIFLRPKLNKFTGLQLKIIFVNFTLMVLMGWKLPYTYFFNTEKSQI